MFLTLLRHATAEPWDMLSDDARRQLEPKGIEEAKAAGLFAKRSGWKPGIVLSSPYDRAWTTATLFCREGAFATPVEAKFLASGMNPETGLEQLRDYQRFDHVVIVGHEPDLSGLIGLLVGCSAHAVQVKKGSLWGLNCPQLVPGAGRIEYSIPAKTLRLFAGPLA